MTYAVGSLVKARGREWVVLPESAEDLLVLRPLGGTDEETAGVCLTLEAVEPAHFNLPDPSHLGDHRSCRLLRDAVRLGFRSSAGPFRSFARIAVEPRPYQLVPLLMALKLDPVRLLIADDVGIGKTIEACLIARELIDRGEVQRLAVLCPPHLAEQWQSELAQKFHLDAELVLASTASRLERVCLSGQSLFDVYPFVVVSTDFVKTDRRRDEFVRSCPEMVIIDEAHGCADSSSGRSVGHQRFQLASRLAANPERHIVLVTATPHSGKEDAFRSLLQLLGAELAQLPETLAGPESERHRRKLAEHLIQRRRGDIRHYLQTRTPFPKREEREETYRLSADYKKLFDKVLAYARESVATGDGTAHRQRVRWWSALALLRSLASSPAAAAATLRSRAASADTETVQDADEIGQRTVLDLEDDTTETLDVTPGSDPGEDSGSAVSDRSRLLAMGRQADSLLGTGDQKLLKAATLLKELIDEGWRPIVFCRFIATADYLKEQLRTRLHGVEVDSVTGVLPAAEREQRVLDLAIAPRRVLVCTDCLSEGINLQEHFDSVVHYDLSWNPTRHEQREGRVDRFGQPAETVRVLTYYGIDNQIDGIVLDVLIRKHRSIRNSLGISVPVPVNTGTVIEAIFEGLLLREQSGVGESYLPGFDEYFKPRKEDLFGKWDAAAEREKRSRHSLFAQETIKVEDVARELEAIQSAVGAGVDVARFVREGFACHGAFISGIDPVHMDLKETPRALRDVLASGSEISGFDARFELPVKEGVVYLGRTHPYVEGLASYLVDTALDGSGQAQRCGVIRTAAVSRRTTLLLVRFRFDIISQGRGSQTQSLAEECGLLAFAGSPDEPDWLDSEAAETLLQAEPAGNVSPDQARDFLEKVLEGMHLLDSHLRQSASQRASELLDAHRRVRVASRARGVSHRVQPQFPVDILGIYMHLPGMAESR